MKTADRPSAAPVADPCATHEVRNQPPPLTDYNLLAEDQALAEGLEREGGAWARDEVACFGALAGQEETIALGFAANRFPPQLATHDRFGHRLDVAEYHPAYHRLMELGMRHQLHALPWNDSRPGAQVARVALFFLMNQVENGVCCPLTMTFAAVPALRHEPDLAREWIPRATATEYDPSFRPAAEKASATLGMAMTEKQGGSDVRANTTRATPVGGAGGEVELTGHKWFCSAPMSDAFLTLARSGQGEGVITCFLVPRWLPDGQRNPLRIQRLKDKLGNRSNASSEIEYSGTRAFRVGEEGRGVRTILEMVHHTRLDCAVGSAGILRQALTQAMHHCAHRRAFGRRLWEQPLMQNVLADLALESEAATALVLRLARAFDEGVHDPIQAAFARLGTAVAKYWICKRTPGMVAEALECLGGGGYVEESILPRLYREAPLSSIWEGSGNVMCLDVLRAMERQPESLAAVVAEVEEARGGDHRLDAWLDALGDELADRSEPELRARRLTERLALALQASLLVRHAPAAVADAFCASRLAGDGGLAFGTLPATTRHRAILRRAWPRGEG